MPGKKNSFGLSIKQIENQKFFGLRFPRHALVNAGSNDRKRIRVLAAENISVCNIADRKKSLAELRRHKLVLGAAMDGFWISNAQGVLEEVNEAYARMSGYSIRELVGMNISQLEAHQNQEEVTAHLRKLMELGHDRFETQHRRKDGSLIDIEASSTFLPESEEIFVFSHDITQRKRAEQALRIAAATFNTQDAILITDAQASIIKVNRAFTEITGYSPDEVIGKNPVY